MDQEIQGDWNKIDKSEFWKDYKYLKEHMGMENTWKMKKSKGKWKKHGWEWEGKWSYKNVKCRMCNGENEILEHTCECEEAKIEIRR